MPLPFIFGGGFCERVRFEDNEPAEDCFNSCVFDYTPWSITLNLGGDQKWSGLLFDVQGGDGIVETFALRFRPFREWVQCWFERRGMRNGGTESLRRGNGIYLHLWITVIYCSFSIFSPPFVLISATNVMQLGWELNLHATAVHKHTASPNLLVAFGSNDNNVHLRYSFALNKTQILLKD